jgi:MoaA/NifB/PqqE/SkfB family radical SAM enzyme
VSEERTIGEGRQVEAAEELRQRKIHLTAPPATISLELTGRCNMKPACAHCFGKHAPGYREPADLPQALLDRLWPTLLRSKRVNDCSFGEPLLYPGFEAFVDRIAGAGVRFGFTTNGVLLGERRAGFLVERAALVDFVVSVDAARPRTYAWLHGMPLGPLLRKIEGLTSLNARRRPGAPPPLALSFIVMRSNLDEVVEFLHLARSLGVRDVLLRHLFDVKAGDFGVDRAAGRYAYEAERLSFDEYRRAEVLVRAVPGLQDLAIHVAWNADQAFMAQQAEEACGLRCAFPWKFLAVRSLHDWYSPCPFLKTGFGAPSREAPEEIWNGEAIVAMRRELVAGDLPTRCLADGICPLTLAARAQEGPSA